MRMAKIISTKNLKNDKSTFLFTFATDILCLDISAIGYFIDDYYFGNWHF